MPKVNPASPPPMMVMGLSGGMVSILPPRNEQMAEQTAGRSISPNLSDPARAPKVRAPANPARMLMRPSWQVTGPQPMAHSRCPASRASHDAARFERDDQARRSRREPKQFSERCGPELMEKQIADDRSVCRGRRLPQPRGGVGGFRADVPAKPLELFARLRIQRVQPVHKRRQLRPASGPQTPGHA